ncbi:MAG: hypothetical protein ACRDN9_04590 [Streptosporangiaceae bacterium]
MSGSDEVMARITEAVTFRRKGDNESARVGLEAVWTEIGPDGDPFHRCVLAHYMADAQDGPREKLLWDQRALDAAGSLTDERAKEYHASLSVRGFYPSLHLNLAQDHHLLGDEARARDQIERAKEVAHLLGDDGYGNTVRFAIARLDAEIGAGGP